MNLRNHILKNLRSICRNIEHFSGVEKGSDGSTGSMDIVQAPIDKKSVTKMESIRKHS